MNHTTLNWPKAILSIYFLLLATSFSAVTIEGKNLLFIGFAIAALTILLTGRWRSLPNNFDFYCLVILLYMTLSSFINYESSYLSSWVYSFFFICTYFAFSAFIREQLDKSSFSKLIELVFWLYFIGLIAGQFYVVFLGFSPEFISGSVIHGKMGVLIDSGQYRYYSLSSEPSYAAFIAVISFYIYFKLQESDLSIFTTRAAIMLVALVYMLYFFKSAYGVLLFIILFASSINLSRRMLLFLIILFIGFTGFVLVSDSPLVLRLVKIVQNIELDNLHSLATVDYSAYYRIAPFLNYFRIINYDDLGFWIGYGASASRHMVTPETYLASNGEFQGGFIPSFFYDYGIVGAILISIYIFRLLPKPFIFSFFTVILMMFNANFNTQLFWFVVLSFGTTGFLLRNEKESS
ncbi:MAG: hypothetical protein K2U26_16425 [Cyclobacteriaceae bacterium]|nr:hypothetical protein [Cyclobacteriaceae bacterium]